MQVYLAIILAYYVCLLLIVWGSKSMKFFILSLDLPVTPLFSNDQDFIPQISIEELLEKYNGSYTHFEGAQKKRYTIEKLPKFLILSIKRFTSRDFGKPEKNPTIVQFPIKNLNMAPCNEHCDCK